MLLFKIKGGCKGLSLFAEKTIDLVLDSFIVTNHWLAKSDIDVKSWLSLAQEKITDSHFWIF